MLWTLLCHCCCHFCLLLNKSKTGCSFFWYFQKASVHKNLCVTEKMFWENILSKMVKKIVSKNRDSLWIFFLQIDLMVFLFIKQQQHKQLYFSSEWSKIRLLMLILLLLFSFCLLIFNCLCFFIVLHCFF